MNAVVVVIMNFGHSTVSFIKIQEDICWWDFVHDLLALDIIPGAVTFADYDREGLKFVMDICEEDGERCDMTVTVSKCGPRLIAASSGERRWPPSANFEMHMDKLKAAIEWLSLSRGGMRAP